MPFAQFGVDPETVFTVLTSSRFPPISSRHFRRTRTAA